MSWELIHQGTQPETYRGVGWQAVPFPVGRTTANYSEWEVVWDTNFDGVTETLQPASFRATRDAVLARGVTGLGAPNFNLGLRQNNLAIREVNGNVEWAVVDNTGAPLTAADNSFALLEFRGDYQVQAPAGTDTAALASAQARLAKIDRIVDARLDGDSDLIQQAVGGELQYTLMSITDLLNLQDRLGERVALLSGGGLFVVNNRRKYE